VRLDLGTLGGTEYDPASACFTEVRGFELA